MTRLISFGCSCTYGHGLPDCFIPPNKAGLTPSRLAWPTLLSNKLNLDCVNLSKPGASNLFVLSEILNYEFKGSDTVVVMWTMTERDCTFSHTGVKEFILNSNDKRTLYWSAIHDHQDMWYRTWIIMYHAFLHLKKLNLKFYFVPLSSEELFKYDPPNFTSDITFLPHGFWDVYRNTKFPLALDNSHAGHEYHEYFTNLIFNDIILNNKNI